MYQANEHLCPLHHILTRDRMDFEYTAEQKQFRQDLRAWLDDNLPEDWVESNYKLPEDMGEREEFLIQWQRTLLDDGWAGITWPEKYGGRNAGLMEQVIYNQEMARVNAPLRINRIGILFVGPTLMEMGTEEQKDRFLPNILNAEDIFCQGYSEPNAGSDLANIQTRAEDHGDHFVINGQKIWTSYAHFADWCFLLARTDDSKGKHQGITALLVPMDQEEISMEPIHQINDDRDFNQVYFDDATVNKKWIVGEVDEGWDAAMTLSSFEHGLTYLYQPDRLSLQERLNQLIKFSQSHTRNGKPLSDHPEIRQKLASFQARLLAAEITHLRYIHENESGQAGAKGSMDKVFSSDLLKDMEDFALTLLGPQAGLWEDGIADGFWADRYFDSFGSSIAGGTSDIQRNIIAERELGLPKDIKQ